MINFFDWLALRQIKKVWWSFGQDVDTGCVILRPLAGSDLVHHSDVLAKAIKHLKKANTLFDRVGKWDVMVSVRNSPRITSYQSLTFDSIPSYLGFVKDNNIKVDYFSFDNIRERVLLRDCNITEG